MLNSVQQLFFKAAETKFHFLHSRYGFEFPVTSVDPRTGIAQATFAGRHLVVELYLDERDEDIDCMVAKMKDGAPAKDYAVDSEGNRVRESLYQMLRRQGVRERLLSKVGELPFERQIEPILEDYAAMLRKHGAAVLNDSKDLWDS